MAMSVAQPTSELVSRHNYKSPFDKASEVMYPGFYSVFLDGPQVRAEMTAGGSHAGVHRYTFTEGKPMALLVDVCHHVINDDSVCTLPSITISSTILCVAAAAADPAHRHWRRRVHRVRPQPRCSYGPQRQGALIFFARRSPLTLLQGVDIWVHGRFENVTELLGVGTWADGVVSPNVLSASGPQTPSLGGYFYFGEATSTANTLVLHVGLSFVDADAARRNLDAQLQGHSFDRIKENAYLHWADKLGSAVPHLAAPANTTINFYTALYRTFMSPTQYDEPDGRYLGLDEQIHTVEAGHHYYSDLSLWDTFRTQNPWLVVVDPSVGLDVTRSLLLMLEQGGSLPRWCACVFVLYYAMITMFCYVIPMFLPCFSLLTIPHRPIANVYTSCMFGDSYNMIFLDTYIKGLTDFNLTQAYEGIRSAAMVEQEFDPRGHLDSYLQYGFVPSEEYEKSVSYTLAYAYNDWAIARFAEILGRTEDIAIFDERAQAYRYHFNEENYFMCSRSIVRKDDNDSDDENDVAVHVHVHVHVHVTFHVHLIHLFISCSCFMLLNVPFS